MNIKNMPRFAMLAATIYMMSLTNNALAIAKCQDANGKWHYGSSVSSKCAKSEITKLNERGVVKDKVAAPKTSKELNAEKERAKKDEVIRIAEQEERNEKTRILNVYEKESDIERARQNNLRAINQQVGLRNAYIDSLKEKKAANIRKIEQVSNVNLKEQFTKEIAEIDADIQESQKAFTGLEEKIKSVNAKYDEELKVFRKHTAENK